jgi:DNA polymerase III epsilon subunit family exonuclease
MAEKPQRLTDHKFAVVDFETTGFSPANDRIVQLAAIVVDANGDIVESFDTVVKPEFPAEYKHGAEHVHGISEEMVANGMPVSQALKKLWDITDGAVFTAHNAKFDIGFLHAESERVGINKSVGKHIDTLRLARELDESKERKHSLEALCNHYGIVRERAHEARADAEATAKLLFKLIEDLGVKSNHPIDGLLHE